MAQIEIAFDRCPLFFCVSNANSCHSLPIVEVITNKAKGQLKDEKGKRKEKAKKIRTQQNTEHRLNIYQFSTKTTNNKLIHDM
jgi:hypothetical protein